MNVVDSSGWLEYFADGPNARFFTAAIENTLHSFNYSDGYYPQAGVIQGSDGALYGTTYQGGPGQYGTLFRVGLTAPNAPPTAQAGPDQTVEATGALTSVSLDGSSSTDPESRPLSYAWTDASSTLLGTAPSIVVSLPLGSHVLTLTVTDDASQSASDTVTVVVADTTAPSIAITTPAAGPFALGQVVTASFVCSDGASGVSTCTGPVASGAPTDTATAGLESFTVSSTDAAGNTATSTVTYSVLRGVPIITWPLPAPIVQGTALSAVQLNAVGSVPGSMVFTPGPGVTLAAGVHTLTAAFTPTDVANYTGAEGSVPLTVNAPPTLTTITGPTGPIALGGAATIGAQFNDPATGDTHTCRFVWDDGTQTGPVVPPAAPAAPRTPTVLPASTRWRSRSPTTMACRPQARSSTWSSTIPRPVS